MKDTIIRIIISLIIVASLIMAGIFIYTTNKDKIQGFKFNTTHTVTSEEVLHMSDKDLIKEAYKNNNMSDRRLRGYERTISSADSEDDIQDAARKTYDNDNNTVTNVKLIFKDKLYYGVKVEWDFSYWKDTIHYDAKVLSFNKNYYDSDNDFFYTTDKDIIKKIYDARYTVSFNNNSSRILKSFVSEKDNSIEYELYYTTIVMGDWGLNDTIYFQKDTRIVNKDTGKVTKEEETIKEIEVK